MATPAFSTVRIFAPLTVYSLFAPEIDPVYTALPRAFFAGDLTYGGVHRIVGTVKEKGTPDAPVVRRVRLFRMRDGVFIRETWSAPDGSYVFDWIDGAEKYFTVSFDHNGNFRAAIADNLTPEAMP